MGHRFSKDMEEKVGGYNHPSFAESRLALEGSTNKLNSVNRTMVENALRFAYKYPGWQSFAKDEATTRCIKWLAGNGFVQINWLGQFRATDGIGEPLKNE